MGQRKQIRIRMSGMKVYIVDRAGLCRGTLENMSCFGMCVTDIPRAVQTSDGRLDAVVFGRGYNFKLQLRRKWETKVGQILTIGVALDDIPWGWADLSMRQEIMVKEPYASVPTSALVTARKRPGRKSRTLRES